jgi:hypothetical protein
MRTIFYATTFTALIAAAACSDNNKQNDAGPPGQLCPTTIVEATNTSATVEGASNSCHVDTYICVVGFQCGNYTQQATCTCDGAKFSCVLSNGKAVQDNVQDTDVPGLCNSLTSGPPADTCPADKTKADGTACANAGQQCYYATACTGSPAPTDVCQCKGNSSGNPGLSWQCDLHACP